MSQAEQKTSASGSAPSTARTGTLGTRLRTVIILVIASFLVGAVLTLSNIDPFSLWRGVIQAIRDLVETFIDTGWDTVKTIIVYISAGAIVVLPIWGVYKLFTLKR